MITQYRVQDSENCVVQFLHGKDGIDATKASYLDCSPSTLSFFAKNHETLKIDINHYPRAKSTLKIAKTDVANGKQFQEGMDLDLDLMRTSCLVQGRKLRLRHS